MTSSTGTPTVQNSLPVTGTVDMTAIFGIGLFVVAAIGLFAAMPRKGAAVVPFLCKRVSRWRLQALE